MCALKEVTAVCYKVQCAVQIHGAGFAMVGEQMPITLAANAADPILQPELAVKAEYLEGGGHSELQMLVVNSDGTTQPLQVRDHLYFVRPYVLLEAW